MYRFQIIAPTNLGESIGLVGSIYQLGQWDISKCVHLHTSRESYPRWQVDLDIPADSTKDTKIEYRYVRWTKNGGVEWETGANNRWIPLEPQAASLTLIVDDGFFGQIQPYPYGYWATPLPEQKDGQGERGMKIMVAGSSVALGCSAWLLKGWAWHLARALQQRYGHQLINRSLLGANTITMGEHLPRLLEAEQPDMVIIALSLGNEGLAHAPNHQLQALQDRFEKGLQQLVEIAKTFGVRPILGGVYPHGEYSLEHYRLLRETRERMLGWGVPILDWLPALHDGRGRWREGIAFDPAHPNSKGHLLMYEAIDLGLFQPPEPLCQLGPSEIPIYLDDKGFAVLGSADQQGLRVINSSPYLYTITPSWQALQRKLERKAALKPGIYRERLHGSPFFYVGENGAIATNLDIPTPSNLEFTPCSPPLLFEAGDLKIFQPQEKLLIIVNLSPHNYNVHPMWKEVRSTLKVMKVGVYEDPFHPDTPFRTLMVGEQGLESRVKIPPHSLVHFQYRCPLSAIERIGIVPLGDRCAVRMLLYKMELDGPAYPFDLTRTSNLADVADIIAKDFSDMWNPRFLHYNFEEKRLYHGIWSGLSFGHEVEDTDNPAADMSPIFERMRTRYSARSQRFRHTIAHCDRVLFIRTGGFERGAVEDLVYQLQLISQGKPFQLLLLSSQSTEDSTGIPHVLHYPVDFNPDLMYENHDHWLYCTQIMAEILTEIGVSSKNLFWCPPNV